MANRKKHKWDRIRDICETCGLKRELLFGSTYTMIRRHRGYEYLVNGEWQEELPECSEVEKIA